MACTMSLTFASAQRTTKPAEVPTQRGPMQSTPLHKPFGAQRRAIHTLAANFEAPRRTSQQESAAAGFVRPDCPPLSDDESSSPRSVKSENRYADNAYNGKPKFRSALEQVSWMTSCAQAEVERNGKDGRLGLGMFGL